MKNKILKLNYILITSCFALFSCSNLNNLNNTQNFEFDLQGHRGCRGWMPENTIPGMIKAVDLGVNTLEIDVCFTKDLQIVASHQPFLTAEITTKPNGDFIREGEEKSLSINQMNYERVKNYDVGKKNHPRFPKQKKLAAIIPRLGDLIDVVEKYTFSKNKKPVKYNIAIKDLKNENNTENILSEKLIEKFVYLIKEKKIESRVIFQSFDIKPLQYIHKYYPAIATSLVVKEDNKKSYAIQLKELGFIPQIYSPHYSLVTPLLVKQCKDMNVRLIPWIVNEASTFKMLKKMGVNGIITDYPPNGL